MLFASTVTFIFCGTLFLIAYERSSPSASIASKVPIFGWFSSTLKNGLEIITGLLSFKLFMFIVILWLVVNEPSVTVTLSVYKDLLS